MDNDNKIEYGYAVSLLTLAQELAKDENDKPTDMYYALEMGINAIMDKYHGVEQHN